MVAGVLVAVGLVAADSFLAFLNVPSVKCFHSGKTCPGTLGNLQALIWIHESNNFLNSGRPLRYIFTLWSICYMVTCNSRAMAICSSLPGFEPENPGYWLSKCVEKRKSYSCGKSKGEGFIILPNLKLPDAKNAKLLSNVSPQECEMEYLKSCSCTGFASAGEVRQRGCFAWYGELNDIKRVFGGN
ncbi:unnamed protein product [Fraxinus pennsylvanica]|uniref:Apple domain-containing protein n=1 Tax=Fraxinus pennsylvanica TaxID=56036 RepID=A0AAD1YUI8_9LAMI|nr:unnamed protein product [Fraxinus pennsylvanica]